MKRIVLIAGALFAAMLLSSLTLCAQEKEQKQEKEKQKTAFVSVAGGVNYSVPKIAKTETWGGLGIAADVQLGKWWSPYVGNSIGWHGVTGYANVDLGVPAGQSYGLHYFNAKVLWNLSNTFGGKKDSRVYTLVPYGHVGLLMQGNDGNFLGFGGGLLNLFRLSDSFDLTLDLQALVYHRAPHDIYNTVTCCFLSYPSASVGVQYKF